MKNIRLIALVAIVAIAGCAPAFASSPDQDLKQAEGLIFKKKYREAIAIIDNVIKWNPMSAQAYADRARANGYLGNGAEAVKDANKAIERAYYNRGVAYCLLKQYQNAVDDFNKAIQLDPSHAESYAKLVFALSRLEQSRRSGTVAVTGSHE